MMDSDTFTALLHGQLDGGRVCYLLRREGKTGARKLWAEPGKVPPEVEAAAADSSSHVWRSVCAFSRLDRHKLYALAVPALWADLDPPEDLDASALAAWRAEAVERLRAFAPRVSLLVDSGRGFHGYWLLREPLRLDGADRAQLAARVEAGNRQLAERLGGDSVGDLSRVMRLPGTVNPKAGAGPCVLLDADGPRYDFAELAEALGASGNDASLSHSGPEVEPFAVEEDPPPPRRRGRPRLGATLRDLRRLPPRFRDLVTGGVWRAGDRYRKANREPDRSRADLAAVGAMVREGFSDAGILAAFEREDWKIGGRFRELREEEGERRALDYLARTVRKARAGERTAT